MAMRHRGWILASLMCLALLRAQASVAWGADPAASLDDHAKAVNRAGTTPEGERRVVEQLSKELNVPAATLRAQREQSKLGWGELSIAYRLSQKTGIPVDTLIAEHKSGKGWGAIAKEHNLKLGPIVSDVKKSNQALEAKAKQREHGREAGKPAKADKGERPEKESKRADAADERGERGFGQPGLSGGSGLGRGHGGGRGR